MKSSLTFTSSQSPGDPGIGTSALWISHFKRSANSGARNLLHSATADAFTGLPQKNARRKLAALRYSRIFWYDAQHD
jgi:hypothetical protein